VAFAAFVEGAVKGYGLDPEKLVFLGYSNGANFLATVIQLHPGLVRRAVLLRAMQVLENPPAADLSDTGVLVLAGREDPYAAKGPELTHALINCGAFVDFRELSAGHELVGADVIAASEWMQRTLSLKYTYGESAHLTMPTRGRFVRSSCNRTKRSRRSALIRSTRGMMPGAGSSAVTSLAAETRLSAFGQEQPKFSDLFGTCLDLARPKGFEPLTPRFVVWCSIQLSYGRLPSSAVCRGSEPDSVMNLRAQALLRRVFHPVRRKRFSRRARVPAASRA
jgi:pimeloyl-ACP methyl ester carboxylesterase